jgi:hypothetical protein
MQKLRQTAPAPQLLPAGASLSIWPRARLAHWATLARRRDLVIAALSSLLAFCLYAATLLPGIGDRDTAELQRVAPTLGLAHPTGYPLYTLLGWLWSRLPLGGTPAWRLNLFSAAAAALAIGLVYLAGRALGQRPLLAAAAAAALAASRSFWAQATIAEVYALAALLQAALILALLRWRAGRLPCWAVGLALGLGLAHHRAIVLMLPGILLFLALEHRSWFHARRRGAGWAKPREGLRTRSIPSRSFAFLRGSSFSTGASESRPRLREAAAASLAALAPCLLYLYLPLHAPAGADPWRLLWDYAAGADMAAAWLDPRRLWAEGAGRLLDLAQRFVWPQLLPIGGLLALLGAARLPGRDRAAAGLLLGGYAAALAFCAAYYVDDVEVFFIPAHLIAALLLGEGAMLLRPPERPETRDRRPEIADQSRVARLLSRVSCLVSRTGSVVVWAIPALLLTGNLGAIRAANTPADDLAARALMAEPLPYGALVIGDWSTTEGPRYLQAVEGLRPDLQLCAQAQRGLVLEALSQGRAVYLLKPMPELGLDQQPAGRLWRADGRPLEPQTRTSIGWDEGIALAGYTLPHGPNRPGEAVPITLAWQSAGVPRQAYTLFVHLIGPDGRIWGQLDRPPAPMPTNRWGAGEHIVDLYAPLLDPAAPPGRYQVNIGWYAYPSMQRLHLDDTEGAPVDFVTLGEIEVALAEP